MYQKRSLTFTACVLAMSFQASLIASDLSNKALNLALFEAARRGDDTSIAELIATGACPDARDGEGSTPLFRAANKAAVLALVDGGASVNAKNKYDSTPLHAANDVTIDAFVHLGADINARDQNQATALHSIVMNFNYLPIPTVYALLNAAPQFDINATDNAGDTALHKVARTTYRYEVSCVDESLFRILLNYGANSDLPNNGGETPRSILAASRVKIARFYFSRLQQYLDLLSPE